MLLARLILPVLFPMFMQHSSRSGPKTQRLSWRKKGCSAHAPFGEADYIICLENGKKFKSLKQHLRAHYNFSPEQYRNKWGLPAAYPMIAPSYSPARSKLAKDHRLGRKAG